MRQKLAALTISLLLLTGCGQLQEEQDALLRRNYERLTGFSAEAAVTADYGDWIYRYDVTIGGTLTEGTLIVTAPENIAGTGFAWTAEGGAAEYDGARLDTGALSADGLSPVDGMRTALNALANGRQLSCEPDALAGEEVLVLELTNPDWANEDSTVCAWLAADGGALRRAEVRWQGTTVVTYEFSTFDYTYEIETED